MHFFLNQPEWGKVVCSVLTNPAQAWEHKVSKIRFRTLCRVAFIWNKPLCLLCVGFPLGYPAQRGRRPRRLTLRLSPTITSLHCSRRDWRRKVESCDCSKQVAVQHFWSRDVEFDSFSWPCCGAATRTWRQTLTANSLYLFVSPKVHLNQIQNFCIMISPETAL